MSILFNGRKDGIRTHGLLVPNQAHYQAVLLPEILKIEKRHLIAFAQFIQYSHIGKILDISCC